MQSDEIRRRIAERIERADKGEGFHATCGLRIVSCGDGRARVEMVVVPAVQNPNGMLHGGAIAALVDHAGTVAILTADREGRPGVTTDLNVTYLAPGPGGATVYAEATVLKCGQTLAFVTVDVRRASDDVLIAQGRMTKFQGPAPARAPAPSVTRPSPASPRRAPRTRRSGPTRRRRRAPAGRARRARPAPRPSRSGGSAR